MLRTTGWIANSPVSRLRTRLRGAVPLPDRETRQRAAIREVDRDEHIALRAMSGETAAANCGASDRALQELEVHVAVAVVHQPLGAEVNLGMPIRLGVADRIDVAELGLRRNWSRTHGVGADGVSVLGTAAAQGSRVITTAPGRVAGDRVYDKCCRDDRRVRSGRRRKGRRDRRRTGGAWAPAIEAATAAGGGGAA